MLVKKNEKEQNSQANRKPAPKSINQIMKNLDNCTEEELEYLKNNFQYDHSAAYLESLQSDLLNKPNKPILFQRPVFVINHILLIKQFQIIEKNQRDFLLHDFQKDSAEYRKLFKWHGFETTRDLFTFVHLQLYVRKWKPSESLEEGLDLEEQAVMQKVLLHTGCHRSVPFKTKDMMSAMENLLDSNLTQIVLHFSLAIFVFEHNGLEEGEFRILVAFQYSRNSPHLANFLKSRPGSKPILMHPDDLFDNFLGRDDPEAQEEIESDMMKLRRLLRDSELSYLYYGFSRK